MTQGLKELRDQIAHNETMAAHHTHLATSLRIQYETLSGGSPVDWGNGLLKKRPTKSHGRWVAWLKANGPAARGTIADAVGLLTGDVPPYADSLGLSMAELVDANYPDDFLLRLSAENPHGHGRPVDVYFLWGQIFDVKPLFGVGPERPDPDALLGVIQPEPTEDLGAQYFETMVAERELTEEDEEKIADLLGWDEESEENAPPKTEDEWRADPDIAAVLSLCAQGVKPTVEQFQLLRSTHPDGPNGANVAIAMAGKSAESEMD